MVMVSFCNKTKTKLFMNTLSINVFISLITCSLVYVGMATLSVRKII